MTTSIVPWEAEVATLFGDKAKSLTIYRVNEQPPCGKVIALYAKPGVGKTDQIGKMALYSPYASPMLYINIDGGGWALPPNADITIVDCRKWSTFVDISVALFRAQTIPFRAIAIDSGSELQAFSIQYVIGPTGGISGGAMPTQQQWGKSTADILMAMRGYHDLAERTGVNVIVTALEDFGKDEGEVLYHRGIKLTPSLAASFTGIVDIIGHIKVNNDAPHYTRVINFATNPLTDAKFRRKPEDKAMKVPLTIAYRTQPVMADVLNTIFGDTDWPSKNYAALQSQAAPTPTPAPTPNPPSNTATSGDGVVEQSVASKLNNIQKEDNTN